jgi:hypothetical protein
MVYIFSLLLMDYIYIFATSQQYIEFAFVYKHATFHPYLWTKSSIVHVEVLEIISVVLYYGHNRNIWHCFG